MALNLHHRAGRPNAYGMSGGWGKGYAIIDELLAELQAGNT